MIIRIMNEDDYHYLIDWNKRKDENFLQQWAGPVAYEYPITTKQVAKRIDEGNQILVFEADDRVIGSMEVQINEAKKQVFISRVLFNEEVRKKGYGAMAMKQLLFEIFQNNKVNKAVLHVYCYNVGAIHCYENVGFRVTEFHQAEDSTWNSYTMECKRQNMITEY